MGHVSRWRHKKITMIKIDFQLIFLTLKKFMNNVSTKTPAVQRSKRELVTSNSTATNVDVLVKVAHCFSSMSEYPEVNLCGELVSAPFIRDSLKIAQFSQVVICNLPSKKLGYIEIRYIYYTYLSCLSSGSMSQLGLNYKLLFQ